MPRSAFARPRTRPVRTALARLALSALAVGGLTLGPARAECPPDQQQVFDLTALKSEMMVLATGCSSTDTQYNAFVKRFQAQLIDNEHALDAYFKRTYGPARAQREHDAYITSLANAQSDAGLKQGSDFCPRTTAIFDEAMSVRTPTELAQYAAGKDLIPASLGSCVAPASPAPAVRSRRPAHGKKPGT